MTEPTDDRGGDAGTDADTGGIGGFEPAFVDVDGTRTRYYDEGEGEPVVLIHGGALDGASSANQWSENLEHLGREHRVLAFDRLACGLTDNPATEDGYVYRSELDHALGFLETLGVADCHLVGASRGGGLAAHLAVEVPSVRSLTLTNSGYFSPDAGDFAFRYDRLFERGEPPDLDPMDPEAIRYRYERYSYQLDHVTDDYCETAADLRSRPKSRRTRELMARDAIQARWDRTKRERMLDTHRAIQEGALAVPVQYLFGRNDLTVRLESAIAAFDMVCRASDDARMVLYNRCGHFPHRERPRKFERDLAGFIDGTA